MTTLATSSSTMFRSTQVFVMSIMDNFKAVLHQVASRMKMDDCCDANGSHASYFIGKYDPYVVHGKLQAELRWMTAVMQMVLILHIS